MITESPKSRNLTLPSPRRSRNWRLTVEDGVHWLVTADGEKFYGCGINGVDAGSPPDEVEGRPAYYLWDLYPSVDPWAAVIRDRLTSWGFNHLGAWNFCPEKIGLPYVANLDLGRWSEALWFDAFDPALPERVAQCAQRLTAPHRRLGLRIGYFPDNEVGWWNGALFEFYLSKDWHNHAKRVLWQLLHDHYAGKWPALLEDWVPEGDAGGFDALRQGGAALKLRPGGAGIKLINEFTFLCAQRYYQLMHDGLRAADPGALIFSDRLPIYYSQDALRAMTPYVDVVAVNYDLDGRDGWLARYFFDGIARLTGKPVLVSEFFCGAMENRSGNKNTGHLLKVGSQAERARVVENALRNFARFPHVVGTHWFQYYDEPTGGRADGEDYNMGLVDIFDRPYEEVTAAFQKNNPLLAGLHAQADTSRAPQPHTGCVTIPRAAGPLDLSDRSLGDWDKERTLMPGFAAAPPYVPFADLYLSWRPDGLYLATIGMDYVNPEDVFHRDTFPLSETYQLHLLALMEGRRRHFVIHLVPEEAVFSEADPTNARGSLVLNPRIYERLPGGEARPLAAARAQHLHAESPRVSCEAYLPAELFGMNALSEGLNFRMNIVVISHYRAQEMYWSEGTARNTFACPEGWRPVELG
jgi:hypothetical protein